MGSGNVQPLRSYPRAFVSGIPEDLNAPFALPDEELKKFRTVLRLGTGDRVVILPNDGRAIICEIKGKEVEAIETHFPKTDSPLNLTLALGVPKPDSLDHSIRMATEIGVSHFCLFASDRTVVKWTAEKWEKRLRRLESISREAAEVCFRTRLPKFSVLANLEEVLTEFCNAYVLSEVEGVGRCLPELGERGTIVIGPEGGWAPREVELIGDRAVTMGPRVFRVDTAVAAACTLALSRGIG